MCVCVRERERERLWISEYVCVSARVFVCGKREDTACDIVMVVFFLCYHPRSQKGAVDLLFNQMAGSSPRLRERGNSRS